MTATLAQQGSRVFATARRTDGALAKLAEQYSNVFLLEMDVESEASVQEAAKRIAQFPGKLDGVVSNAGVSVPRDRTATVLSMLAEDLEAMLQVNVVGAARVIRHFDPLVKNGGWFATVTSEAGSLANAFPSMPGYAISKAAENKLVSVQHATVTRYRVLAIHPGRVDTDMGRESAQISTKTAADALSGLLCGGKTLPQDEWFFNYLGEPMPH